MSSVRSVFARNLRALCKARGLSVNAACKGLGIPRSQMDRYLNGDNLPNNRNLARMSAFFGVEETCLFAESGPVRAEAPAPHALRGMFDALSETGPSALAAGIYKVCFSSAHDSSKVMVSLMSVKRRPDITTFRRMTRFPGSNDARSAARQLRGDHRGIVVDRFNAHYFVGTNRIGTKEPSFTVMRPLPVAVALSGRAIIMAEEGPMAVPVVMEPLPATAKLRDALTGLGLFDFNSPVVGALAARLLRRAAL